MTASTLGSILRQGALALTLAGVAAASTAQTTAPPTYWSPSWMAATQPLWDGNFVLPSGVPFQFNRQTVRQVARLSIGGARLRVVISNEGGTSPLHIGAARVARHGEGSAIVEGSDRAVRFGGQAEVTVPPGARMISDPVDLPLPALSEVAVSLYLPRPSQPAGFHFDARQTAYVADGDLSGAPRLPTTATQWSTRVYVSGLIVETPRAPTTVVALGDSLTDGNGSTPGANTRWPDALAERLAGRGVGVLNAGNSGGRLLKDGMGRAALERVGRDVFSQPGVRAMVVMLGTNDIGWPGGAFAPQEPAVRAEEVIQGFRQLIEMAHAHNVRIMGATIAPNERGLEGTPLVGHHSPEKDRVRQAVNQWIRESGAFDAVVDFDALLRDAAHPIRMKAAMDSGDHLHPGDAGYKAMAAAIDLEALLGNPVQP
ncbi:SGNH/GDSL hydrolase family protein [Variovorax sp. PAMC26660]|uniref:SGNH/GDSL hydrolase family protein n=1 Tax=Variovorax sp. PAMC26660 TaxID=2762322 RepID=UPI00164D8693|nr:SGNH/GDSL hydrolase family protein [Variovorax sp. PAMC26660]QNK68100.1 SGNH/GDSL hydrolase family protein [Variovorax sp. PAMC26660]